MVESLPVDTNIFVLSIYNSAFIEAIWAAVIVWASVKVQLVSSQNFIDLSPPPLIIYPFLLLYSSALTPPVWSN